MIGRILAASVLLFGSAGAAQTYRPSFRPDTLTDRPAGPPNEVVVLGTPHLSGLPDSFRPAMVEPLLERLARWRPTVIATEDMSGARCDDLRRRPAQDADTIKRYCYDPTAAGEATGLDVLAAEAEMDRTLAAWPATPSPAQRRRLAAVFLAAGEPGSALVQWLRLPPEERRADGMLDATLAADLSARALRKNETFLIAAALAARVGLERLSPVEDQGYHDPGMDDPAYGPAVMKAWDNPAAKARAATFDALYARVAEPDGLLAIYRAFNAPDFPARAYQSDWGAALAEPSPQAFGRRYVGYWETRNLRVVANIREVLGRAPGSRMLAIVGASHKAYYEAYLAQMRDVTLVDVKPLLR
jgi:hypothetical protein